MKAPHNKKARVGFRLVLLAGITANVVGCAIHHYHHFDEKSAVPPAPLSMTMAGLGPLQRKDGPNLGH